MKTKVFTLTLILFCIGTVARAENKEFENYAQTQSKLMQDAYEKRDVKMYGELFDDFKAKYSKLPDQDQKYYRNYLINGYYNFCCTYAILKNKKMAIDYLDKSIKAGYVDYSHISTDSDLDYIRNDAGYIALITPLRKVGDYMYIIKHAAKYNAAEKRTLPEFTYQAADNPNLVILRKTFNLDSIAGKGNEVSKVINLMYWIHNLVPHDGNHGNPTVKNALSMIAVCKQEKRGLNCRGLATVLNECYLSMGIKSRFVTCLPKDSLQIDNDCHVINMVYINSLKKWIWIDPTFCAYVMDEKGQLLGLEEVRERLINDKTLIINPDANWNHISSESKEYYLNYYMAKNLYRLECATSSEYDTETRTPNKTVSYIQLLPLDYFKQTPEKTSSTSNVDHVTYNNYNTNNPAAFWAAPVGK
ncbi:transglutaminase superfamily protein [Mucilaginibacter gracilis]|uniref:Transglutaminase superfamily protein n=1 Tax=Mucilaginibacter gracilis TaxID=423350 RepID=A0A495IZR9_9SPHI|nr:transglutaminase-like domain-containing protein [Mucilaginibacter gracilis]RKR82210.1 transglutaminase superfamily protein [Mucilaginibacter gracilis]